MESKLSGFDKDDAGRTLAQLGDDRVALSRRTAAPTWFAVAIALCASAFIMAFGLPRDWFIVGLAVVTVLSVTLGVFRQRITGSEFDPWSDSSARAVGLGVLVVAVAAAIGTIIGYSLSPALWILITGAVVVGGLTFASASAVARRSTRASAVAS